MKEEKIKALKEKAEQMELNMNWRLKEECGCCGISLAQWQILAELVKAEETCICHLAEFIGVDSSTLSRTINRMVEAGLVDRITNALDRRYVSLSLTDKGKLLYQSIEERDTSYYSKVFESIPKDKREQVIESLHLFIEALQKCKEQ